MTADWAIRRTNFDLSRSEVVVVVDVLRAFTTTRILLEQGVKEVLLSRDYDHILELTEAGYVTFGEYGGYALEGLTAGNSPSLARSLDIDDRPVALLTTNGVPVVHSALGATTAVYATGLRGGRFLPASLDPDDVEIWTSDPSGEDDLAVAEYLKALASGNDMDFSVAAEAVRRSPTAEKFLDEDRPEFEISDLDLATAESDIPFIMVVVERDGQIYLQRHDL